MTATQIARTAARQRERTIMSKIWIKETSCEWGETVSEAQNTALHAAYRAEVARSLADAYPDDEIDHEIDIRMSGDITKIAFLADDPDEMDPRECDYHEEVRVRDILGASWQATLERYAEITAGIE